MNEHLGPDGIGELRGHPRIVSHDRPAREEQVAARLWEACEELTEVQLYTAAPARVARPAASSRAREIASRADGARAAR